MKATRFVRMFKPQFAHLVAARLKCQTIRPTPKRMPKAQDIIDCREWTGRPYQSKQRRLCEAVITAVVPVTITWSGVRFPHGCLTYLDADKLARDDGFSNLQAMLDWFHHEYALPFSGILIKWGVF